MKVMRGGVGRREPRRAVREKVAEIIKEVRLRGSAEIKAFIEAELDAGGLSVARP